MAELLSRTEIVSRLEQIIKSAKRRIILISPYLKISRNFRERLLDADSRRIPITLIYGKEEETPVDEIDFLAGLNNMTIRFLDNLHAKCFANEDIMVIGSMNLHQYSEVNNREMGILIDGQVDPTLFDEAMKEIESIRSASRVTHEYGHRHRLTYEQKGFCIRCGKEKYLNLGEPYCKECYFTWAEFKNRGYVENLCYMCGRSARTTIDNPFCYDCKNKF